MAILCIPGEIIDKFKTAFGDGTLDPDTLASASSAERRKMLEGIVGADKVHEYNSFIESKIVLKDWKRGILNAVDKMTGLDKTKKAKLLKSTQERLDRLNEHLDPKQQDKFLEDLAQDKVGRQYRLQPDQKETAKIVEYSNSIDKAEKSIPQNAPDHSSERIDHATKVVMLDNYIGQLEKEPFKVVDLFNPSKVIDVVGGTLKSAVASLDDSFFGRQGIKRLYTRPDKWMVEFASSFRDIGRQLTAKGKWWKSGDDAAMDAIKIDVLSRKNALNGKYDALGGILKVKSEEAFPSTLPEKIPLFGRLFKTSEVAYNGGALRMRADLADESIAAAERFGVDVLDKKQMKHIGNLIGSMTGRGDVTLAHKGIFSAKTVNAAAFSVKFLQSNVETLLNPLKYVAKSVGEKVGVGGFENVGEKFALKKSATNILKIVGSIATILWTAEQLHPGSTTTDMNSPKFGKIQIGNTYFDVTGGLAGLATMAAKLTPQKRDGEWGFYTTSSVTGKVTKINTGKYGSPTALDAMENFFEWKASPLAGIFRDILKGEDFGGNKPTPISLTGNATTPLLIQNYRELKNDPDSANILIALVLEGIGISTNTYGSDRLNKDLGELGFEDKRNLLEQYIDKPTKPEVKDEYLVGKMIYNMTGPSDIAEDSKAEIDLLKKSGKSSADISKILDVYFKEEEKDLKNPRSKTHKKMMKERHKRLDELIKSMIK